MEGLGFPKQSKYLKEAQLTGSFLKDLNIRGLKGVANAQVRN